VAKDGLLGEQLSAEVESALGDVGIGQRHGDATGPKCGSEASDAEPVREVGEAERKMLDQLLEVRPSALVVLVKGSREVDGLSGLKLTAAAGTSVRCDSGYNPTAPPSSRTSGRASEESERKNERMDLVVLALSMPAWLGQLLPILILLAAIGVVLARLPRVDLGHSPEFLRRRFFNWFPLGLTYAFLYMGRYNLTVSKNALGELMSKADFGTIFFWGTLTYGCAFLLNGPLTDRWGGRVTILISSLGSSLMNLLLGVVTYLVLERGWSPPGGLVPIFSAIYAANMYFQSFGAVSIVKVNAAWFHIRERGVLGGVFGILISLGVYFAFDWGTLIVTHAPTYWVFFVPAAVLAGFFVLDTFIIRDSPSEAGHKDFDVGDASSGDTGPPLGVLAVAKRMFGNPVILIIAAIEFCSGFLRNAIMHWYPIFAKQTGISTTDFVPKNWGMLLCVAGIMGGMFAGVISDRVFNSRRGPVSAVLYGGMIIGISAVFGALTTPLLGWVVIFASLCVIGVHGMLSGTASMDFGGRKNAGVAVGIIDGCVYLGTATQSILLGQILPKEGAGADNPASWGNWPIAMLPVAIVGFVLATRVWNAKPKKHTPSPPPPATVAEGAAAVASATKPAEPASAKT
jgi:OPA family glycerol-3-phosphate transporter-like MFS transporter